MKKHVVITLLCAICIPVMVLAQSMPEQQSGRPITNFLNEDGTFSNPDGYSGAVDLAGFQMGMNDGGLPVFFNADDDNWTLQSYGIGLNGHVNAIVVVGDDVYVGGNFTTAGGISASRIARYNIPDKSWHALGSGVSSFVHVLAVSGTDLYVGGAFTNAGGVAGRNYIARYDMAMDAGNASWHPLGGGVNNEVLALAVSGTDLYVGGYFTSAGGQMGRSRIARYDMATDAGNDSWHPLGSGVNGPVLALAVSGTDLYIVGSFTGAGGVAGRNRIARYDMASDDGNDSWHALGSGLGNNAVYALVVSGTDLYVGGTFTTAGGVAGRNRIARYDMTAGDNDAGWHPLGSGVDNVVFAMAVSGTDLYVGGSFTNAGGVAGRNRIARYDMATDAGNDSWHAVGSGVTASVNALLVSGTDLYVGGEFGNVGGMTGRDRIVGYDLSTNSGDTSWFSLGSTISNTIHALAVSGSDLYFGGEFTIAGGVFANRVARYNMTSNSWHPLGSGVNSSVWALAVSGTDLYVGGWFTSAGGLEERNYIARYDMSVGDNDGGWHGLGSGVNSGVYALAVSGTDLYVGGEFTSAGGMAGRNYIARYDMAMDNANASWHGLGDGLNGPVYVLAVSGSDLYVGGQFTSAGGVFGRNNIARYDMATDNGNASWHGMGDGLTNYVLALAISGSDLYVGGAFTTAGGLAGRNHIARYDMTAGDDNSGWYALGGGTGTEVRALAVLGSDLYVGGAFTTAGGLAGRNHIARYDMTAGNDNAGWYAFGSGFNSTVNDMAVSGTDLYVGGFFTTAGGKPTQRLGRWFGLNPAPAAITLLTPLHQSSDNLPATTFTWAADEFATSYQLQIATNSDFDPTTRDIPDILTTEYTLTELQSLDFNQDYFWRVRGIGDGGSGAWSAGERVFKTIPGPVTLVKPDDESMISPFDVEFEWELINNIHKYNLEISKVADFGDTPIQRTHEILVGKSIAEISDVDTDTYILDVDLDYATTYYWRIQGVNNDDAEGAWSDTWSFTTTLEIPAKVELASPQNGINNLTVRPEFEWDQAARAWFYRIQVATDIDFENIVINEEVGGDAKSVGDIAGIDDTSFTPEEDLLNDTQYFWRVRADNSGGQGAWSDTWQFHTEWPVPQVIELSTPGQGATHQPLRPTFTWEDEPYTHWYLLEIYDNEALDGTPVYTKDEIFSGLVDKAVIAEETVSAIDEVEYTISEDLENGTQYFWRVRGKNNTGNGDWSASRNFTTIVAVSDQVTLVSPADGAGSIPLRPEYTWNEAIGATGYQLQVSVNSDMSDPLINEYYGVIPQKIVSGVSEASTWSETPEVDLDHNTTYYWQVRGWNDGGSGDWSPTWSFVTINEIPAKVELATPIDGAHNLTLRPEFTWNPADRAWYYRIQVATDADFENIVIDEQIGGETKMVGDVAAIDNNTFTPDADLLYDTGYYWQVRAVNDGGPGEWSDTRSFSTQWPEPAQISLVGPADNATNQPLHPTFSWANVPYATQFEIEISTSSDFTSTPVYSNDEVPGLLFKSVDAPQTENGANVEYTISEDLENGTQYFWRVRGKNNTGNGDWSASRNFTTIVAAPEQVTLVSPADGAGSIPLRPEYTWNEAIGATGYQLQVSVNSDMSDPLINEYYGVIPQKIVSGVSEASTWSETPEVDLDHNTTYYWQVRGWNEGGSGDWSPTWSFVTINEIPAKVELATPIGGAHNLTLRPEFTWNPADRAWYYRIQVATDADFENIVIDEQIGGETKMVGDVAAIDNNTFTPDADLLYDTGYYWQVRAVNDGGQGAWSDTWQFRTQWPVPAQISLDSPADNAPHQPVDPTFSWANVPYATQFEIEISTSSDFTSTPVYSNDEVPGLLFKSVDAPQTENGANVEYTITEDLENDTQYFWRVRGRNNTGNGDWSASRNFTTIVAAPEQVTLDSPENEMGSIPIRPEYTWNEAPRATGYQLQVSVNSDMTDPIINEFYGAVTKAIADPSVSAADTWSETPEVDLAYHTTYYWQVRGLNDGGSGEWSDIWIFTTIQDVPAKVELASPIDGAHNLTLRPEFTWSPLADIIWYYRIQVATDADFENIVIDEQVGGDAKTVGEASAINNVTFTPDADLAYDTGYFWQVQAVSSGGVGAWSDTWSFSTQWPVPAQTSLQSPANNATNEPVRPTFSWADVTYATQYEIEISTSSDFMTDPVYSNDEVPGLLVGKSVDAPQTENGANVEYMITQDLNNGTTYFWRVRGKNDTGSGAWSTGWGFTTIVNTPDVITLVSPVEAFGVAILTAFSWEPDALATSYDLELSATSGFTSILRSYPGIAGTDFTLTEALQYDTNYFWRVRGTNASGEGPWSESPYFTTMASPVPYQPTVFFPTNGQQNIFPRPEFSWEYMGEGVTYDFDLALRNSYDANIVQLRGYTPDNHDGSSVFFTPSLFLLVDTDYWWRVRAENEFGPGEWNDFFVFKTTEATSPLAVQNIRAEPVTFKAIPGASSTQPGAAFEVSWSPPIWDGGSPITDYRVIYKKADEGSWTTYLREASTDTVAIVSGLEFGVDYNFNVLAVNAVGSSEPGEEPPVVTSIHIEELPDRFVLQQNYPNPFNPSTTIRYALPHAAPVTLEVYSTLGQRMMTIQPGVQSAGWYTVTIDGSNLSSGVYIYRLQAGDVTMTKKFMLVK